MKTLKVAVAALVALLAWNVLVPAASASGAACVEIDLALTCYDSEAELLEANPWLIPDPSGITPFATCSSSLILYANTGYTGTVIYLTTRSTIINLSHYGMDNATSSYKVGACSATFYAGANGTGSVYPGSTGAGAQASSMVSGWDNTVSSVYIH